MSSPEEPYREASGMPFFEKVWPTLPNVISAYLVSGFADYRLEVGERPLRVMKAILKAMQNLPYNVKEHSTSKICAIRCHKTTPLPLVALPLSAVNKNNKKKNLTALSIR